MQFPRVRRLHERYMMNITLTVMVLGLIFVYLSPILFVTIPAGHVGVRWYRFLDGTDTKTTVQEGTHMKFPWDEIYDYDARVKTVDQEYDAITRDGLMLRTTISFRYRIHARWVGVLHKNVGPDYLNVLLIPEIGTTARGLIAKYNAEEFYTRYRDQVRDEILVEMQRRLFENNSYSDEGIDVVALEQVMLKSIVLPDRVASAIEGKIEQYQRQLEYDFRLQIEAKEKERKQIEGEGVRRLFDQVGEKELASYLRLAGINATLELAKSPNAKIIISGSSLNALPLLIGNDSVPPPLDQNAPPAPQAQVLPQTGKTVKIPNAPPESPAKPNTSPPQSSQMKN